jgi:hypothetical protein
MKPRNFYRIIVGVVFILSGIPSILLSSGEAIIITGISRHREYGDDPESDERSKKIGACGVS